MPHPPRVLTHNGRTLTLNEWAKIVRLPANTIRSRIDKQGWDVARAMSEPLDHRFSQRRKKLPLSVPRPVPAMKEHRTRHLAYATWHADGRQVYRYFGEWGSSAAAQAYQQFAAEWVAGCLSRPENPAGAVYVADLVAAFVTWAGGYYLKDGKPTSHVHRFKSALAELVTLYGEVPVSAFTPDKLRAYAAHIIGKGFSLRTVNEYQWRVVFAFDWGVTRAGGMVPAGIVHAMERVEKQQPGRSAAPDRAPVRAALLADVEAALPYLHSRPAARAVLEAAVRLQLASGMRPGELCALKVGQIDQSGAVWRYEPREVQKNRHRGQRRVMWFGPKSQAVLTPLLAGLGPTDFVFAYSRRKGGERKPVTVNLYRLRVADACERAGVGHWHPHQLRHNRATELQRRYECDDAVRIGIGDSAEVARQVYVDDPAEAVAKRIAKETG